MAHFAKVENGIVTNVIVVANEHETNGQEYLNSIGLEGTWIQTSYNANFRGKFAGIGDTYNSKKDRFEPAKPYPSWIFNEETYGYDAPVPHPDPDTYHVWNEEIKNWEIPATTE